MKPIGMVEKDLRYQGIFLLVDIDRRRLRFYGFKKNYADINRAMDSLKGRSEEMVKFLIERAKRVEG